jgi:hypothetical protein
MHRPKFAVCRHTSKFSFLLRRLRFAGRVPTFVRECLRRIELHLKVRDVDRPIVCPRTANSGQSEAAAAAKAARVRVTTAVLPVIRELQALGIISLQGIARELTRRGTGAWQAVQVQRVLDRAG